MTEFHVGDTVYSRYFGRGIITEISERERPFYPITVKWVEEKKKHYDKRDSFMINGQFHTQYPDPEYDIIHLESIDASEETNTEDDKLIKKDAINPSHYKVDGLPEAIDIMNHLMTPEQFEGFLWGNIMKYAYRYGRKGDKAETAGKIAWYANQLKALEEWRKENET